jgi:thioesterase domain-containing protein
VTSPAPARVKPGDPLEIMLADIWADVLGRRPLPVAEPFAALGGSSGQAARMVERVEQACGVSLAGLSGAADLSIADLARAVKARAGEGGRPERRGLIARNVARGGGASRPELFYLHGDYNGGGLYCLALACHIGRDQPFYGLAPHGADGAPLPPTIEAMADDRLRMLRALRPSGPYRLAGHCNGALVAFEIARRLAAEGERVERLVLVSPRLPARRQWTLAERFHRMRLRVRHLGAPAAAPAAPADDPLTVAYRVVMGAYTPGPFAGEVAVLWPAEEDAGVRTGSTRAWRRAAPALSTRLVPGAHLTCVTTHAAALGAAMRECLGADPPR